MKFVKPLIIVFAILFSFFNTSCVNEGLVDSPPAFVEITKGPGVNEILDKDRTAFQWKGSGFEYIFRYRLYRLNEENVPQVYQDWSEASESLTEAILTNLDDGRYRFEVEALIVGIQPIYVRRDFSVNALVGPTFSFNKTVTRATVGSSFSVFLNAEDVANMGGYGVVFTFDTTRVQFTGLQATEIARTQQFSQLIIGNHSADSMAIYANRTGSVSLTGAFLLESGAGVDSGFTGKGDLVQLQFTARASGESYLTITSLDIRRFDFKQVEFTEPRRGIIIIQ